MRFGLCRRIEEAKSIPAGVELSFRQVLRRDGAMFGDDAIGKLRGALVEEGTRKVPPFIPPDITVPNDRRVFWRQQHVAGSSDRLAVAPELPRIGKVV